MENTIKVARLQTIKEFRSSQQLSPGEGIRRVSCVTLWINDLNSVRGSLGHVTGEQVLALCVERIASEIRDSDEVLDLGGDAFAVLLHDLDRRDVVNTIAERLLYRLQRSLLIEDHVIDVAVTAGIAIGEAPTGDYDLLIKRSSFALHATRSHSDPSFFDAELEHQLRLKQSLSYDLRKALPLRQFFLHYQPQVDIVRGRVSGVEALVRWQHPILGLVSPGDFIPLAEATGFICDLGAWVLRTACKYAFTLDPQITMAVNVSPIQFRSPQFISDVRDALAASGLTGSRLEIEITEGVLLNSSEVTSRAVESLRELGVRIAMRV